MAVTSRWDCDICGKVGNSNDTGCPRGWSASLSLYSGGQLMIKDIVACSACLGSKIIDGKSRINYRFILDKLLYMFRKNKGIK